ncbi:MAG TPA: lytic transglycosylase domain-containing protein, partial [Thermoanaerobaculia bacterium]|nr:lytic transglycosylase domain-containing protein [Thermoanaerobaculia bacterium]
AARRYKLDPLLLAAVARRESGFRARAVSPVGARGIMQLMPATARELGVKNSFDPRQNINGGAKYLRRLMNQYRGNINLALAAYNAGPGAVRKYRGIPPYRETRAYVKAVRLDYDTTRRR